MTVKEVAARLQVSPSLVYAMCAAGVIAHSRHGLGRGTIRIGEDEVRRLEEESRVAARKTGSPPLEILRAR